MPSLLRPFVLLFLLACALRGAELDATLLRLADDKAGERAAALAELGASREPLLVAFFEDYRQNSAYLWNGRLVLVPELRDDQGVPLDPLTRKALGPAVPKSALTEVPVSRKERGLAIDAITRLRLSDPDHDARLSAVTKAGDGLAVATRPALAELAANDSDARVRRAAAEGVSLIDLSGDDAAARIAAADHLSALGSGRALSNLRQVAAKDKDDSVRSHATTAVATIESYQLRLRVAQTAFSGLSAGSILIIMALGLSITFGLMGIINMAHGEMLMIGAYATLLTQWGVERFLPPSMQPWYFLIAVVTGFLAAGAVGWLLELTIIRHLYGRPLETLLATWGVSFLLIKSVRSLFGDNQAVTAPPWLVGGWEPMPELVLPWNRLFIIALTAVSIVGVWLLLRKTRLGLLLRATTQSRRTASSLGVNTRRIDGLTFALGSGLAGAAGCAMTLIGGLKPDMGQEFIIDSFLVVATGGVGNLAGVVWAGLSLGLLNKLLEPWTQAVFAKVLVLIGVIIFLQWKPSGLFPAKGRLADG